MQHALFATYPADISSIFETTDENHFPHAYTSENLRISAQGFPRPKNSWFWYCRQ